MKFPVRLGEEAFAVVVALLTTAYERYITIRRVPAESELSNCVVASIFPVRNPWPQDQIVATS